MHFILLLSFALSCAAVESSQARGGDTRSAAYDNAEFIFGHDNVCAVKNANVCVALGSSWNERAIRNALPGYKITYSNECEGFCFIAKTDRGILEILGSGGRVELLRSLGGAVDFRGNGIGSKLKNAVGYGVSCDSGLNFVCTDSTLSPIGYIVDGCDEAFGSQDGSGATVVPDCATISGFQLKRLEYLEESVGEPEDGNDDGGDGNTSSRGSSSAVRAQKQATNRVSVDDIQEKCGVEYGFPSSIAECLFEEEERYGAQLAEVYKRLLGQQSSIQEERLRKSQRAWLEYQRHFCEFHELHYQYEAPGVPFPPGISKGAHTRCLLETTVRRLNELQDLLEKE